MSKTEYLKSLVLPTIPGCLENKIKIGWSGLRGQTFSDSVFEARNFGGEPYVKIQFSFKSKIMEEEHLVRNAQKELNIIIDSLYSDLLCP